MTQSVEVPGVGTLQFPDGMSQQDMAAAIQKNYPEIHPPPEKKETPLIPTWYGAAKGVGEAALTMASGVAQQAVGLPKHVAALAEKATEPLSRMTPEEKATTAKREAEPGVTEKLQGLLQYTPKTPEGKYLLDQIQSVVGPVTSAIRSGSEQVIGKEATDVASDVIGLGGVKGAGTASRGAAALKGAVSTQERVQGIIKNLSGGRSLEKTDVGGEVGKAASSTLAEAKKTGTQAYEDLAQIMGPGKSIELTESTKAAGHYGAGIVVDPKVKAFSEKLQSVGSMTFDSLKQLRTQISDAMGTDRNVNRQLRGLRDAVTKDIDKAAESLSPEAKKAWDKANAEWKAYVKTEDTLNRTLGKNWQAKTSTELYDKVLRTARSDPQKISQVMGNIKDPAVKQQFAASMLHHMADRGGEFDGDKLIRNWDSMNPQARKVMFDPQYEANMTKLVGNLKRIQEGHRGLVKEVSGIGVAAILGHFIPGGTAAVGAVTLGREAYKFGPKAIEAYLTSPQWVRTLAERTTAFLERGSAAAVVGAQQANTVGNLPPQQEPARVGDVQ
jgi:hypothetical protein